MHIFQDVFKNCKEYIDILRQGEKGCFLTRGVFENILEIGHEILSITERKPKHIPLEFHNAINAHFNDIFGWPVRNGLFSVGAKSNYNELSSLSYGTSYLLFPCGNFQYVYDPNKYDLYVSFHEFKNTKDNPIKSFIDSINYSCTDINTAMSNIIRDYKSVEIIINCESYYLINMKYVTELTDLIWN